MQRHIQIIENSTTAYPTVQLPVSTFAQVKPIQNEVMTTAYHDIVSDIVTTLYQLLHPRYNLFGEWHDLCVCADSDTTGSSHQNVLDPPPPPPN